MQPLISALAHAFPIALVSLSIYMSFRVLRFPDLGIIGSVLVSAYVYGLILNAGPEPGSRLALAVFCGITAGSLTGLLTGLLHYILKISSLISGIAMIFIAQGFCARIATIYTQDSSPILKIHEERGLRPALFSLSDSFQYLPGFSSAPDPLIGHALIALITILFLSFFLSFLLKRRVGIFMRGVGENRELAKSLKYPVPLLGLTGMSLAGMLAGCAGVALMTRTDMVNLRSADQLLIFGFGAFFLGAAISQAAFGSYAEHSFKYICVACLSGAFAIAFFRNMLQVLSSRTSFLFLTDHYLIFGGALIVIAALSVQSQSQRTEKALKIY